MSYFRIKSALGALNSQTLSWMCYAKLDVAGGKCGWKYVIHWADKQDWKIDHKPEVYDQLNVLKAHGF